MVSISFNKKKIKYCQLPMPVDFVVPSRYYDLKCRGTIRGLRLEVLDDMTP